VSLGVVDALGSPIGRARSQLHSGEDFAAFYRSHYPVSVRLAYSLVGSIEAAEDVVQELFSRLHARFAELENPGAYLRTGIIHECQDTWRRRRLAAERVALASQTPRADPHDSSELFHLLLRLSYRQRAVLVLRYWADWSEAEIADALGCRPTAVRSLASRGLTKLRRELEL
jgi:RNA polymerase sigma factor (sigma-70 family)